MTLAAPPSKDTDPSDGQAAWLRFVDSCQVAVGHVHAGGGQHPQALIPTLLFAASELHSRAHRLLARTVILRIASRLNVATVLPDTDAAGHSEKDALAPLADLGEEKPRLVDSRVRAVLDNLHTGHIRHRRQLADMAVNLRVSTSYLSRLVVSQTGLTFSRHMQVARMDEAARLLDDTGLSVKEIASASGYEHVPSFDRQFRRYFRVTPSEFRRLSRTATAGPAPAFSPEPRDPEVVTNELRESHAQLRATDVRLRHMLGHSGVCLMTQDRDLHYTWVHNLHPSFEARGVLGKTDHDLLSPGDAARATATKLRVLTTGVGERAEAKLSIDGEEFSYAFSLEPIRDEAGSIVGISCLATDITEHLRHETRLTRDHAGSDRFARVPSSRVDDVPHHGPLWVGSADDGLDAREYARRMSPREREVVKCLLGYRRLSVVADVLGISVHTARNHLKSVFRKLDLHSQDELFRYLLSGESDGSSRN